MDRLAGRRTARMAGWLPPLARGRTARAAGGPALLAGGAGLLAGCGSPSAAGAGPGASCGTTRTAADVAVIIKVVKGTVDCSTALRVENEYAAKVRAGQVLGNGGGAPVAVSGWNCQGSPTPEVLSTGTASQCHTSRAAIVAVLAATCGRPRRHRLRTPASGGQGRRKTLALPRPGHLGLAVAGRAVDAAGHPLTALRPRVVLIICTWSRPLLFARYSAASAAAINWVNVRSVPLSSAATPTTPLPAPVPRPPRRAR